MGLILAVLGCGPKTPPQALPEHADIVAFEMNIGETGRPSCLLPLDTDGSLCKSTGRPRPLTDEQADAVRFMLSTPETWGEGASKCFVPYLGFAYYDAENEVTQQVAVSLICEGIRATPDLPVMPRREDEQGLSPEALLVFAGLCQELNIEGCRLTPKTE